MVRWTTLLLGCLLAMEAPVPLTAVDICRVPSSSSGRGAADRTGGRLVATRTSCADVGGGARRTRLAGVNIYDTRHHASPLVWLLGSRQLERNARLHEPRVLTLGH